MSKVTYDPRERFHDQLTTLHLAMDDLHSRIWTALPCIIKNVTWNNGAPYAEVELAVMGRVRNEVQQVSFKSLPKLPACPILFPRGGGYSITFPVNKGDEALVIFSCRSIDEWFSQGKAAPSFDLRMTDLSDGIVIVGLMSEKRTLNNINTSGLQIRSDDGKNSVTFQNGNISAVAQNEISLSVGSCELVLNKNGVNINKKTTVQSLVSQSTINASGGIVANDDIQGGGISLMSHIHGGVQGGSGTTGTPE